MQQKIIAACRKHTQDLIDASRTILNTAPHISYHLSTLALEEIGKAVILRFHAHDEDAGAVNTSKKLDDHVKKIFWALWGESFLREVITKEQISEYQGFSKDIHEKRLSGLYVSTNPDNFKPPRKFISKALAQRLLKLVEERFELEKTYKNIKIPKNKSARARWFIEANDDPQKRALIFGTKSQEKLIELRSVIKWVDWLKKLFDDAERDAQLCLSKEVARAKPVGDERYKDKWKMRFTVFTNSHLITAKALNNWNSSANFAKLLPIGNQKDRLYVDFTFPMLIPLHALYDTGKHYADRLILSFSIGSLGFYWWHIPNHVDTYYDKITDLESRCEVKCGRTPSLKPDWPGKPLTESDINNIALCYCILPHWNEKDRYSAFHAYLNALTLLGKNDIHLSFHPGIFEWFHTALSLFSKNYTPSDKADPFYLLFGEIIDEIIPGFDTKDRFIAISKDIFTNKTIPADITLEECLNLKVILDAYIMKTFAQLLPEFKNRLDNPTEHANNDRDSIGRSGCDDPTLSTSSE